VVKADDGVGLEGGGLGAAEALQSLPPRPAEASGSLPRGPGRGSWILAEKVDVGAGMKALWIGLCLAGAAFAGPATAQDMSGVAGLLATATEGIGQTVGEAVVGAQSIFVTAQGKARLPGPLAGSYFVNVEGVASKAVDAAKVRDDKLNHLRDVAKQFGVEMTLGESQFSLQPDLPAQNRRIRETAALNASHPGVFLPTNVDDIPKLFHARTGVRFNAPADQRTPEFLDAIRAAGVEDISADLTSRPGVATGVFQQASEVLGFGTVQSISDGVWSEAEATAVRAARVQAAALAVAAGRKIGDVRSILLLSRSIGNGDAVVSVAVRFSFAS
jgi:uncharacterized protein YggE